MTSNASRPKGFFAFPSHPTELVETILAAVNRLNNANQVSIKPWTALGLTGNLITAGVLDEIDRAQFFCADLRDCNPNVLFEIGYAIAKDKRTWLTLDPSIVDSKKAFEDLRILTTIGYAPYANAEQVERAFYVNSPQLSLESTILKCEITPSLQTKDDPHLLYVKSLHDSEASVRITKAIHSATRSVALDLVTDDPSESPSQTLRWYGTQVASSRAVVMHFTDNDRRGAPVRNARMALVAGMALGLGRPLLLLARNAPLEFQPIDFRDLLCCYGNFTEAVRRLAIWLQPILDHRISEREGRNDFVAQARLARELGGLRLGDHVAENEAQALVDEYFVETAEYRTALETRQMVFVGRKGSGKTANLLKLSAELGRSVRNLVVIIKPVAYEMSGVLDMLARFKDAGTKGFVIESLWKFLVYSEIAKALEERGLLVPDSIPPDALAKLNSLLDRDGGMLRQDFAVRLERCADALRRDAEIAEQDRSIEAARTAISELLHRRVLSELRLVLADCLAAKDKIVVLVDNLDKAWDRKADLDHLAEVLLGLLSAANRIGMDFAKADSRRRHADVSLVVFLRADIFYKVQQVAREPDKLQYTRMTWDDSELLLRVLEERFVARHDGNKSPNDLWSTYFCPMVRGKPTREYLVGRILKRPRDLVFFANEAIGVAVNRGRVRVEEADVLEAEKRYSQFAFDTILVENGISLQQLEAVLYEFAAQPVVIHEEDLILFFNRAGVPPALHTSVLIHLRLLGFLGTETSDGVFTYMDNPRDQMRVDALARATAARKAGRPRYEIAPAFRTYLEIVE